MSYPPFSGGPPFNSPVDTDTGTLGNWRGEWSQQSYVKGDQVIDSGWLMIANTNTNDRAAPQPIGNPASLYSGTMINTSEAANQVLFGQRYTAQRDYWVKGIRVFSKVGARYAVYFVKDPLGAPVGEQVGEFTSGVDGWRDIGIQPQIVREGDVLDLFVQTLADDPAPVIFSGDWDYKTPPQVVSPSSGDIIHSNAARETISVSKTDDIGGDRSAELATLGFGDVIRGVGQEWGIQGVTDQGTYIEFAVLPEAQGNPDGVDTFEFESIAPTEIEFGQDDDYWLSRPELNVSGFKVVDGQYPPSILDDNAYGVDAIIQLANISPEWDFQSFTTTSTSDISDDGLVIINAIFGVTGTGVVSTTNNDWTEIARTPIVESSDVTMTMRITSKRTDAYGTFSAQYIGLLSDDGGLANLVQDITTDYRKTSQVGLNFRVQEDGGDFVFEVRGRNSQDWNWRMVYFGSVRS